MADYIATVLMLESAVILIKRIREQVMRKHARFFGTARLLEILNDV